MKENKHHIHNSTQRFIICSSSAFPALPGGFNNILGVVRSLLVQCTGFPVACEGLEVLRCPFQRHRTNGLGKPGDLHRVRQRLQSCTPTCSCSRELFPARGPGGCSRHHPWATGNSCRWKMGSLKLRHFPLSAAAASEPRKPPPSQPRSRQTLLHVCPWNCLDQPLRPQLSKGLD